ncbi:MAG TPA: HdeA/HdeB family chaperone [Myxococcota bacterium]|nr:HdeA/HdeB family chaperone [Myxococcota bacterium]
MKRWIIGVPAIVGVALTATIATPAGAETKTKKVDEITCEEFLALNPNDQQRIAYWVDGYAQAKNEAEVGTVAFDKFGQPIGALIEDCKVTPKDTLWQKLKQKAKKYF